jgi:hypothetical protein
LVGLGVALVTAGLVLRLLGGRFGHLPGDLRFGDAVYVPITSCLIVSAIVTVVLNVLARLFGR